MYHTSLTTTLLIFCIICSLCSKNEEYDYYDILGVKHTASLNDIKTAYDQKKQSLQNSPQTKDVLKLKRVYDVLTDQLKRKIYDVYGEDGLDKQDEEDDDYYYNILRLKPDATQREIKKAYRHLSIMFHPDKRGNTAVMKPLFTKVRKAYEKLYTRKTLDYGHAGGSNNIGFSVGGAKDINNFRDNIENNFVPLRSSITYEGIFYDYYFDTGSIANYTKQECMQLFCPTYSSAVININTANINNKQSQNEYYISVGFNSGIKQDEFKRKPLNLVIVLDISGSMSTTMEGKCEATHGDYCTKLNVAKKAIISLFKHLFAQDRIGIVTFDHNSYVINKLDPVEELNMDNLSNKIRKLQTGGSTNMEAGYKQGTILFSDAEIDFNDIKYENRIIFLTDAMPNTGMTNEKYLLSLTQTNVYKRIYTTFIGIGLNFNSKLIETITKIRGGNYYSVNSYKEFMKRMDNEFEFMVTPLVFNMSLSLKSTRNMYTIDKIYGSTDSDVYTAHIIKINTLFPSSPNDDGEIKGGITLLKLKLNKTNSNVNEKDIAKLKLFVNYEDRNGEKHENFVSVIFTPFSTDNAIFDNNGIRKAILLSQYVSIIHEWIDSETHKDTRNNWDVKHKTMNISFEFKQKFEKFLLYFEKEMKEIGDETLQKEVDILKKLAGKQTTNKIEL